MEATAKPTYTPPADTPRRQIYEEACDWIADRYCISDFPELEGKSYLETFRTCVVDIQHYVTPLTDSLRLITDILAPANSETYERVAELFTKETGFVRPGKSCQEHSHEVRLVEWSQWVGRKISEARALLPAQ